MYYALAYLLCGALLGFLLASLAIGTAVWTRAEAPYVCTFCAVCALLWPVVLLAAYWQHHKRPVSQTTEGV